MWSSTLYKIPEPKYNARGPNNNIHCSVETYPGYFESSLSILILSLWCRIGAVTLMTTLVSSMKTALTQLFYLRIELATLVRKFLEALVMAAAAPLAIGKSTA